MGEVFQYTSPLLHPASREFVFVEPSDSDLVNPWKECFKQLVGRYCCCFKVFGFGEYKPN